MIDAPASDTPIVLVHGFASSFEHGWRRTGWVDILGDLGRPVIGPDLLGHGRSPRPEDPAAYAEVPGRLLADLGSGPPAPVDAVGFSAGARALLGLACGHPDRFRRLVLLGLGDTVFDADDRDAEALADGLAGTAAGDVRTELFRRVAHAAGNDVAALTAFLRYRPPPLDEGALGQVTCPVLLVLGDRDDMAGGAGRLVAAIAGARMVALPGVDHFGTVSDFGAIDAVVRFLSDT